MNDNAHMEAIGSQTLTVKEAARAVAHAREDWESRRRQSLLELFNTQANREGPRWAEICALKALLMHAILDAPDVLDGGRLDMVFKRLYVLLSEEIDTALVDAGNAPSGYDMALWELMICLEASASILAECNGKKSMAN